MNAGGQIDYRDGVQRSANADVLALDAHYYTITNGEGWPIAGLLVLLDGPERPQRAELQLYDELPSHIHEGAIGQARQLLQRRYSTEAVIPMRVLMNTPMRDAVEVRLDVNDGPEEVKRNLSRPLVAVFGAVAVIALLAVAAFALRGTPDLLSEDLLDVESLLANGTSAVTEIRTLSATGQSAGSASDSFDGVQIELPESVNARSDLRLGTRVAIVPGLRLTLRSEPGAESGVPLGYMMDEDTAVIVGGPRMTAGTSDTIVWWLVNLDDGTEAWAAANTSDQTLLIPAP